MSRGSRIVAIGGSEPESGTAAEVPDHAIDTAAQWDAQVESADYTDAEAALPAGRSWIAPLLAGAVIAGWTGFFGWSRQAELLAPSAPADWSQWVSDWSLPVLLVCTVWLLAMRNSRREASRFGDAARLLSFESERLEARLVTVNSELSLAREFIAAQSRDLEALGRMATERLSQNADRLQELIKANGAQVEAIGTVSGTALENMERLRGQLPVIASSAKDVTNNIANAGRTAHAQLQEMIQGFKRLNEFGQASERQVEGLRAMIDTAMAEFAEQAEQLDTIAAARFSALAEQGAEFRTRLDAQEVEVLAAVRSRAAALAEELREAREHLDQQEQDSITSLRARLGSVRDESTNIGRALHKAEAEALAAWQAQVERVEAAAQAAVERLAAVDEQALASARTRLAQLGDEAANLDASLAGRNEAFAREMDERRAAAEAREAGALEAMRERLAALDAELAARRSAQEAETERLAARGEAVAARIDQLAETIGRISGHGSDAEQRLGSALATLARNLADARDALTGTDVRIGELTDSSVRLLELIQASVHHSREDLPVALSSGEYRLVDLEQRIGMLKSDVEQARSGGEELSRHVLASDDGLQRARAHIAELAAELARDTAQHDETLAALAERLRMMGNETRSLAESARGELSSAIEALGEAAREAVSCIETQGSAAVARIADQLGSESGKAIETVMHERAAEAAQGLEQAATQAAQISREATIQLRDQLAKVNELAGNLERRVAHARNRAEEQVDNDFARRVALITESLNSNAIDIAKVLSTDVSDTAWSSYLKGDRGIFTRRSVNLLDSADAKSILQLYEANGEFRDHVSRYIHDFEAMLRQLLSTRDGHALGVTLLSSDMGKLYVALAQAIERLRT